MKISGKNDPRNTFWDILGDFGKIDFFFHFGGQNHLKNGKKIEILKKNTMYFCGDFDHQNGVFKFFNGQK